MSKRYFGTDGIRGRVGEGPVTAEFALRLGAATGRVLGEEGPGAVLIGKDTRISGYLFESALEAGLSSAGADIRLLGPMPTPAVAYLTCTFRAAGGIVISASHNPYTDNGFKFFSRAGEKLDDAVELAIERALDEPLVTVDPARLGRAERIDDAPGRYIEFCKSTVGARTSLRGLHIVVDCANGATYHVGPRVLEELGARVTAMAAAPDGVNINRECGSTSITGLERRVVEVGADLGIAFDGDGDRTLLVDETGRVVDGDELLFLIARSRLEHGSLQGGVVGTLMTNLGVASALADLGVPFARAKVGDRYVLQGMKERGWELGGEGSGHIICLDKTTTGDGIVSALAVLEHLVERQVPLSEFRRGIEKFPQHMINVPVTPPADLEGSEAVRAALAEAERRLGEDGRVVLRPSGTEPVVRVTVEGRDETQVRTVAGDLARAVGEALGP